MHGFGGAGKKESWLTPAQLWCTAGAFNANSLVWKKNRHCFHCFPYCWSKNVFQVLKCDRKYLGWVNCSSALMSKLLLLQHSQAHSMFWLFTSDVSPCTLILFLSFILQPGVLFLSGHHCNNTTKGSVQPRPMTGAFSCCWSYVRRLKISKTAKFQGESSSLGSTAAIKEKEAEHPPPPHRPLPRVMVCWALPLLTCVQGELLCAVGKLWLVFSEEGLVSAVPNTGFWQARQCPPGMFASA